MVSQRLPTIDPPEDETQDLPFSSEDKAILFGMMSVAAVLAVLLTIGVIGAAHHVVALWQTRA